MNIYDIDNAILEAYEAISEVFDEETGEVTDIDNFEALCGKLDELQMERERKISNIACWIKNLKAEAEAIKTEEQTLNKRRKVCENKVESLKKYLEHALHGDKFKDARVSISYRKSEGIHFAEDFDFNKVPGKFIKCTIDAKKTEMKEAIKAGEEIPGVCLITKNNLIIK